MQPGLSVHLN